MVKPDDFLGTGGFGLVPLMEIGYGAYIGLLNGRLTVQGAVLAQDKDTLYNATGRWYHLAYVYDRRAAAIPSTSTEAPSGSRATASSARWTAYKLGAGPASAARTTTSTASWTISPWSSARSPKPRCRPTSTAHPLSTCTWTKT
ncbi:MAG: hypothetical protein R2867_37650 [Caldilineaceae bacterium]